MDSAEVFCTAKKGASLSPVQGRPVQGVLANHPLSLHRLISELRSNNPAWGAETIRVELKVVYEYSEANLPSTISIHRYLKSKGLIAPKVPKSVLPEPPPIMVKRCHDLWEMDAQGAEQTKGVDCISMINIKDSKSKAYISSFPVQVQSTKTKPRIDHYLWAMRFGFEQFGLPKAIQVDRDSAFIANKSTSPFPSLIQLFLIGLGVELHFIKVPPPQKQAMVERSHQTMDRQTLRGKTYSNWHELFVNTNKRRMIMNEHYPCRTLNKKAPLQAFEKARHSGRLYSLEQEENLIDKVLIEKYLASCEWFRKTSGNKTISLHGKVYYLKHSEPQMSLKIKFCFKEKKLIFRNDKELIVQEIVVANFVKNLLMQPPIENLLKTREKIKTENHFVL